MDLIVIIAWLIWYGPNVVVLETSMWYVCEIIDKAKGLLVEFRGANLTSHLAPDLLPSRWNPPHIDLYKVNFDVAWAKDHNEVKIGVVRDHRGDFFAGLNKIGCKWAAELVAALEVINFAVDASFRNILLDII